MTRAITVMGLKRCDTCRKARQWLEANAVPHDFVDYREQPVSSARLRDWAQQLGGFERLVNRSSTTWRQLPENERSATSDDEWCALIATHPTLIRRPVLITADGGVSVGFKDAAWRERLGLSAA